jgi:hypothetical protein
MDPNRPDPNKDRNDQMVPEYWDLGDEIQNRIVRAGYESPVVEGLAVDIHDLLQAVDRIRDELGPATLSAEPGQFPAALKTLADEIDHIRWHCDSAMTFLNAASLDLGSRV